jgi:MFS family permease
LNLPALALLLLLFPDGRVPSPRWRVVPWLLALAVAGVTVWTMLQPGPMDLTAFTTDNPAGVTALDDPAIRALGNAPGILVFLTLFVGSVACALAPFVRRRRAGRIERQQLKWLALVAGGSGLVGAVGFLIAGFASSTASIVGGLLLLVALVGIAVGIPVAVGLAILRYRLYDIDRVINRTLVYGVLTAVLGFGYAGMVLLFGQLFGGVTGDPPSWAIAAATLAVAALFQPARRRIQQAVDRRFNRRRYDTARTIQAFSARLRDQIDLDTLTVELLAVVDETMQPTQASVWLRDNTTPARASPTRAPR